MKKPNNPKKAEQIIEYKRIILTDVTSDWFTSV